MAAITAPHRVRATVGSGVRIEPEEMSAFFEKGFAKFPAAAYLAGLAALDRGDYQQALRLLSTAIEVDPRDVWAYLKRAAAYEQTGDREKAIADYRSVLAIDRTCRVGRWIFFSLRACSNSSSLGPRATPPEP
jgi:tetratricopeptide (TPR) repeat protein